MRDLVADIRTRDKGLEPDELDALIEEARDEFYTRPLRRQAFLHDGQPDAG
jgi:hypothetical protein